MTLPCHKKILLTQDLINKFDESCLHLVPDGQFVVNLFLYLNVHMFFLTTFALPLVCQPSCRHSVFTQPVLKS